MQRMLSIAATPVSAFPAYANTLSILLNHSSGINWFMENYLQRVVYYDSANNVCLSSFVNINEFNLSSYSHSRPQNLYCPLIQSYLIPRAMLSDNFDSLRDFLISAIENNFYISIYVDRKEISAYHTNEKFVHELFIYGFDDGNELFYIMDYFNGSKFNAKKCSFSEFDLAFENADKVTEIKTESFATNFKPDITLLRYSEANYNFHPELLKKAILNYLNGREPVSQYSLTYDIIKMNAQIEILWGRYSDLALKDYLSKRMKQGDKLDIRQICVMLDHKQSIYQKYLFLIENKYINDVCIENANSIVDLARLALNIGIKYNLKNMKNEIAANKMVSIIGQINNDEQKVLEKIYINL